MNHHSHSSPDSVNSSYPRPVSVDTPSAIDVIITTTLKAVCSI